MRNVIRLLCFYMRHAKHIIETKEAAVNWKFVGQAYLFHDNSRNSKPNRSISTAMKEAIRRRDIDFELVSKDNHPVTLNVGH